MNCFGEGYETKLHCSCYYTSTSESHDEGPDPTYVYRCCSCGKTTQSVEHRPWLEVMRDLLSNSSTPT